MAHGSSWGVGGFHKNNPMLVIKVAYGKSPLRGFRQVFFCVSMLNNTGLLPQGLLKPLFKDPRCGGGKEGAIGIVVMFVPEGKAFQQYFF